jgi:hypothetical protein
MKWFNISLGVIGIICIFITIIVHYVPDSYKIIKNKTIYYTSNSHTSGYQLAIQHNKDVEMKPNDVYGINAKPKLRCAVLKGGFKGGITTTIFDYPFHEVVIEIDDDLINMEVRFPKHNDDQVTLSLRNILKEGDDGYMISNKTLSDRIEKYIDIDGDFLPDKRVTYFKPQYPNGRKRKVEVIRYTYEEEIEQAAPSNR